jgi:hypothetical protein
MITAGAVRIEPSTGLEILKSQGVRLLSERHPVSGAPISLSHRSFYSRSVMIVLAIVCNCMFDVPS